MATRFYYLLCCCLTFSTVEMYGQKSCGTVTYQEQLKDAHPSYETKGAFEIWMSGKLKEHRSIKSRVSAASAPNQVITIPVVMHIIHNGEAVGSGTNLDESRIIEQIERLNKDFRRLNADTVNTPVEYLAVAADTEIEFTLAKRDPYGLPTSGIVRVQGSRPVYDLVHNTELKALSYWPAEDYMNIWVVQLESLLGYAQFPVSTLGGLEIASENRLTDGVVIDTDFFGNNPGLSPESIGRSATHEVGHFLGLRHTWGDGGCGVDDFCDDTPLSNSSNFGCPDGNSCGSDDMVENYLDLSDDLCMNLFTLCQKNRMRVILSNSPRRASLVNSSGALPPVMVDNDAGVRELTIPQSNSCLSEVAPTATIQNTGTNQITSFQVQLLINDISVENQMIVKNLNTLEITTVSFAIIPATDMMKVEVSILKTNGVVDGNPENNKKDVLVNSKTFTSLPIMEGFPFLPPAWDVRNDDNSITWKVVTAPSDSPSNTAAQLNFFSYGNANGEYDYLITPALDLTTYTGLTISFDLAYAPFSFSDRDGLIVAISVDCGNSFPTQNYVYQKEGQELATAPLNAGSYLPSGRSDWRTETINLDQFAGLEQVKIAFIGVNDFGNNLYLDNININGTRIPDLDLAIVEIPQPSVVSCEGNISPQVVVKNTGLNPVSSFQLSYQLGSGGSGQFEYNGPSLETGANATITFAATEAGIGSNNIIVSIDQVEGQGGDGVVENNTLEQPFIIDDQQDLVPKIETFEQPLKSTDWRFLSLDESISWAVTEAGGIGNTGNQAVFLNFFSYSERGAIDYLTSPVLDLDGTINPTVTFDLAYAGSINANDGLLILASTNCGVNYNDTLFQAFGAELATVTSNTEFIPDDPTDWTLHKIDLSKYAGQTGVRLAFVGVNDFGNNLFIDNIQFFISDRTTSLDLDENQMIVYPNPALGDFYITFNLLDRSSVDLRIIDPMGRVVWNKQLPNILNQTLGVQLPHANGVYILQATGQTFRATSRIILVQ